MTTDAARTSPLPATGIPGILATLAVLTLVCAPWRAAGAAEETGQSQPALFHAEYGLHRGGMRIADMSLSLEADGPQGHYLLRQEARTRGLAALLHKVHTVEESRWRLQGTALRPLEYRYQQTGGRRQRQAHLYFDWPQQRIINRLDNSSRHIPAEHRIMDKLLYKLAVMHELNRGEIPRHYLVADSNRNKRYYFTLHAEEEIDTALGPYTAVRLERSKPGDSRRTLLWCAPTLRHLPVRIRHIEKDGVAIEARLEGINWSSPEID